MSKLKFLFRADSTNVGDWWCPPFRYFRFRPHAVGDILDPSFSLSETDILILGGGGLGTEFFRPHLKRIAESGVQASIVWGAGVDATSDRSKLLSTRNPDLYGDYFDFASDVGIRVHSSPQKFRYVPCASCMHDLFPRYRDRKPSNLMGLYNHKRVPLRKGGQSDSYPVADNSGSDLEAKLKFLSRFEYIVTNTYHGVYWATLLERKVICLPYKSGLMSFKHPPAYCWDGVVDKDVLDQARTYPGALEEARRLNAEFYRDLTDKYDLV